MSDMEEGWEVGRNEQIHDLEDEGVEEYIVVEIFWVDQRRTLENVRCLLVRIGWQRGQARSLKGNILPIQDWFDVS
jgi:hypothetical protein